MAVLTATKRILVVVCGITGAAINHLLRHIFPTFHATCPVWERQSVPGVRMRTDTSGGLVPAAYVPAAM